MLTAHNRLVKFPKPLSMTIMQIKQPISFKVPNIGPKKYTGFKTFMFLRSIELAYLQGKNLRVQIPLPCQINCLNQARGLQIRVCIKMKYSALKSLSLFLERTIDRNKGQNQYTPYVRWTNRDDFRTCKSVLSKIECVCLGRSEALHITYLYSYINPSCSITVSLVISESTHNHSVPPPKHDHSRRLRQHRRRRQPHPQHPPRQRHLHLRDDHLPAPPQCLIPQTLRHPRTRHLQMGAPNPHPSPETQRHLQRRRHHPRRRRRDPEPVENRPRPVRRERESSEGGWRDDVRVYL